MLSDWYWSKRIYHREILVTIHKKNFQSKTVLDAELLCQFASKGIFCK